MKPRSRTAAAGSDFLKALGSDLAALVRQLRYTLHEQIQQLAQRRRSTRKSTRPRRAPSTGRSLHRLILGLAVVGIASMLVVSAALLWALLGLPIDRRPSGPNQPTLLLEAADGEALGRVGLLRMPDATLPEFGPLLVKPC